MYMTIYILNILASQPNVMLSWGMSKLWPLKGDEGIIFHVEGFKFNGWVKIVYDQGADLFNISYIDNDGHTRKKQNGIYVDTLVSTIDNEVEKTSDYEKRVNELYSWIKK